ncbi:MAG: AAA family ATPase [Bacteroidales bacterium]|nr:AAA family ATPase [Bacteroidales bacterium]
MIIGRVEEKKKMLKANDSEYSQFVTVYGRRRVGKTFFVRETFNYKFTFEHAGLAKAGMKEQLAAWQTSMKFHGYDTVKPKTWLDAFNQLKELIIASPKKKKVIFIDEMPWMDTPKSGFISALEFFWNGWASARKDITLIVCGSATSWIINKIIRNKAGLHGRVTTKIRINPFTLAECEKFATHYKLGMNRRQLTECSMVMGGIPYYWSLLDREKSLAQNIDDLFFQENGELHNEFNELYRSLFKNPEPYIKVIEQLGARKVGMTREELISSGIKDNGKLTELLADLEQCGFIRKYAAYGYSSHKAIFQLIDPYTLFYYKFILANDRKDERFWSHSQNQPTYNNWCGLAFERICLLHVNQIKQALGITGVISGVCGWQALGKGGNKGAQIDLIIDRNDDIVDLCEIKYSREPYIVTSEYYDIVLNKTLRFKEDTKSTKSIHQILISANGVKRNAYSDEFQKIITLDSLFEPYIQI